MKFAFPLFFSLLLASFATTTTAQTVFRHVTSAANTSGHITTLDNPQLNGNPNAIVFAQPIYAESGDRAIVGPFRVTYQNNRWVIAYQRTNLSMAGVRFQVMAVPLGTANAMVHVATAANMVEKATLLDDPALNGNPNAILLVTQQSDGNNHEVGVQYQNNRWRIFNLDGADLLENARFSVMIATASNVPGFGNAKALVHTHTTASQLSNNPGYTVLDNAIINGNASANVFLTQQSGSAVNPNSMMVWYDSPNDNANYKNGYWLAYGSNPALQVGVKINVIAIGGNPPPPTTYDLTGFYSGDNGNCGQAYIRQIGNRVYWFGEHPNGSFGHVFSGTINGNILTGNLWDVPKGTLMNKGNCVYNISTDGNTLTLTGGTIGCNVLAKTTMPSALPANKPMQAGSGVLTGVWDCNDGAATYVREDSNDFIFFSEAKNNGTQPGFANLYIGKRNGSTITGDWVDVPKGTHLGSGKMTLRVESDTRIVRTDNGNGYGGGEWTRDKKISFDPNNLPSRTIATVYTDCGFGGQSYHLQVPQTAILKLNEFTFNPKELGIPDNSISSIKLSKGYSATLYFANGGGSADIITDENCLDLYKLTNISSIRIFKDARLKGYADMHTHPMSHLGFGKRLMHGVPDLGSLIPKGTRYKGFNLVEKECNTSDERATTIEQALGTCNATHGGWGAENDCGNYIRAIVISKAFDGDFVHNVSHDPFNGGNVHGDHHHEGIETSPSFMYWPHQTSVTHQQMWWEWLKRTYDGGLRVMVALTVNSELFAEIIDGDEPKDDKASADLQLDEIISFVGRHDEFMEIARTPADLRRIVGANKMAVLLGMEVDNIGNFHKPNVTCNESTVRTEIQRLYNKGVRYIFPIHLTDNKFGGAAVYEDLFNYVNRYSTGSLFSVEQSADATINFRLGNGLDGAGNLGIKAALDRASGISFPPALNIDPFDSRFCPVPTLGCWDKFKFVQGLLAPDSRYATYTRTALGHVNAEGLTPLGEFAIREMMKLGMVIDVDHMSAKAINRSLSIAESVNGGYPINMGHNGIRIGAGAERSASIEMVKRVSALGGMFGVGTADTNPSDFVKNYNVAWYVMGSRNTAIGTDVNGFEPLPKASPNLNSNDFYRGLEKCTTGNRTWDYTKEGVAHYGLMTEFLRDARLQQNGYEMMNSLMLSAEYFAQMWEKCERQKTQIR
ncbi:MAG: membrane dipeptidase [Saprospiraceae bacterium]